MDCSITFSFSAKPITDMHVRIVSYVMLASLAASVICFGALGAIQNECGAGGADSMNSDVVQLQGVDGFSGVLSCKKLYRYWWFVTAMGFVCAAYGLWNTVTGKLMANRAAIVALLIVSAVLSINMTNAFLNLEDVSKFTSGTARDRARTMIAGCVIVSTIQCVAIFLAGVDVSPVATEQASEPVREAALPKAEQPKAAEAPAPAPVVVQAEPASAAEPAAVAVEVSQS